MSKRVLITGITGQDGSYLTEYLLSKGYEVHGIIRRSSTFNTDRIDHLINDKEIMDKKLFLKYGDLTDYGSLITIIRDVEPDEVYNLGAQTHVKVSFEMPIFTGAVNQDEGGLPACTVLTANTSPNQRSQLETSVDFPVASGPTKAITAPPDFNIRFLLFPSRRRQASPHSSRT